MHNSDDSAVSTASNGADDRQPDGKFAIGNRAASGRRSRSASLRAAFECAVTEEAIEQLVASMLQAARFGDVSAAKLLCDQVLVKPGIEAIVQERLNAWKWELLHEILCALDADYHKHVLRGSSSNVMGEVESRIRQLPSFRD